MKVRFDTVEVTLRLSNVTIEDAGDIKDAERTALDECRQMGEVVDWTLLGTEATEQEPEEPAVPVIVEEDYEL